MYIYICMYIYIYNILTKTNCHYSVLDGLNLIQVALRYNIYLFLSQWLFTGLTYLICQKSKVKSCNDKK